MITRWFGSLSICYDAVAGTSIQWLLSCHPQVSWQLSASSHRSCGMSFVSNSWMTYASVPNTHKKKQRACQNQHKNGFWTGFLISNFTIQFTILDTPFDTFFFAEKIHASSEAVQDLVDQSLQRWLGWMIGIFTMDGAVFFTTSPTFFKVSRKKYRKNVSSQHAPNL